MPNEINPDPNWDNESLQSSIARHPSTYPGAERQIRGIRRFGVHVQEPEDLSAAVQSDATEEKWGRGWIVLMIVWNLALTTAVFILLMGAL